MFDEIDREASYNRIPERYYCICSMSVGIWVYFLHQPKVSVRKLALGIVKVIRSKFHCKR